MLDAIKDHTQILREFYNTLQRVHDQTSADDAASILTQMVGRAGDSAGAIKGRNTTLSEASPFNEQRIQIAIKEMKRYMGLVREELTRIKENGLETPALSQAARDLCSALTR